LKSRGLWENTLVVFTTDNGYFHGEHGLADKWYPYQESIRVPLIVRDGRLPAERRGRTEDRFVLNVDLAPTFLAAAGVKAPAGMQGKDLAPLYAGDAVEEWRTGFYYEHPTITSKERIPTSEAWVTKDAKFIRWPEWEHEEFFDLKADPHEINNTQKNPANRLRISTLRKQLEEGRKAAK
jgi:arylsulfatase A-like enzyme